MSSQTYPRVVVVFHHVSVKLLRLRHVSTELPRPKRRWEMLVTGSVVEKEEIEVRVRLGKAELRANEIEAIRQRTRPTRMQRTNKPLVFPGDDTTFGAFCCSNRLGLISFTYRFIFFHRISKTLTFSPLFESNSKNSILSKTHYYYSNKK